jgi:hypothetical protein
MLECQSKKAVEVASAKIIQFFTGISISIC